MLHLAAPTPGSSPGALRKRPRLPGVARGVAGTVVLTAFQKFVEMPLTKRGESFAPASVAEKVTPTDTSGSRRAVSG